MSNCPNCGAPITGLECEYCGTSFRGYRRKVPGLIEDGYDISKLNLYLKYGAISTNEARVIVGLEPINDDSYWISKNAMEFFEKRGGE